MMRMACDGMHHLAIQQECEATSARRVLLYSDGEHEQLRISPRVVAEPSHDGKGVHVDNAYSGESGEDAVSFVGMQHLLEGAFGCTRNVLSCVLEDDMNVAVKQPSTPVSQRW